MNRKLIILLFLLSSCYHVSDKIQPQINYSFEDSYLKNLSPSFPSLTASEIQKDWGKEYLIAEHFAKDLDLYRAISTFRRAEILAPERSVRKTEIQYYILFCYYLAKRYDDAIYFFEHSDLSRVDETFSSFHDLLVILYDCYNRNKDYEKIKKTLDIIQKNYPETAKKLQLSTILFEANIDNIKMLSDSNLVNVDLKPLINEYEAQKKSVSKAQFLNIIPGMGYLYLGQKRSALTSFLINGLFIFAAYEFFHNGYVAAGIITTGFEAGWYFGGIYGAGLEAKYYNERTYEQLASKTMNDKALFPIFMLKYSF